MPTIWKTIPEFSNYEVSNKGKIRNKKSGKVLKPAKKHCKENNSRYKVILTSDARIESGYKINMTPIYVHRAVALTFLENPDNLPEVNHKDGNFHNNKLKNLEWINRQDNIKHSYAMGQRKITCDTRSVIQLSLDGKVIKKFDTMKDARKECKAGHISDVCYGKRNHSGGFKWKFEDIPNLENEEWKVIEDYPNYQVSNKGRVKHIYRMMLLKGLVHYGYKIVKLTKNNITKGFRVHRLVAEAFIENPDNKSCVDHINTDKLDNNVENLRWVTNSENMSNINTRKKRFKAINQYSLDGKFIKQFESITLAEKTYKNVSIGKCVRGYIATSAGFKWEYTN